MLDFHENRELEPVIRNANYNNLNFKNLMAKAVLFSELQIRAEGRM